MCCREDKTGKPVVAVRVCADVVVGSSTREWLKEPGHGKLRAAIPAMRPCSRWRPLTGCKPNTTGCSCVCASSKFPSCMKNLPSRPLSTQILGDKKLSSIAPCVLGLLLVHKATAAKSVSHPDNPVLAFAIVVCQCRVQCI